MFIGHWDWLFFQVFVIFIELSVCFILIYSFYIPLTQFLCPYHLLHCAYLFTLLMESFCEPKFLILM